MHRKFITLLLISSLAFTSCSVDLSGNDSKKGISGLSFAQRIKASDRVEKEVRKVQSFDGIEVSSAIQIEITDGPANNTIQIDAPDNVLQYIKSEVKNGVLVLRVENSIQLNNSSMKVTFPHQKIRYIKASGASTVKVHPTLKVEQLKIDISGASVLKSAVMANKVIFDGSGASSVQLTGNAQDLEVDISGASNFKGQELKVANVMVECSGASTASVWAVDQLKAQASGASTVRYVKQDGLQINRSVSGASSVKEVNK